MKTTRELMRELDMSLVEFYYMIEVLNITPLVITNNRIKYNMWPRLYKDGVNE